MCLDQPLEPRTPAGAQDASLAWMTHGEGVVRRGPRTVLQRGHLGHEQEVEGHERAAALLPGLRGVRLHRRRLRLRRPHGRLLLRRMLRRLHLRERRHASETGLDWGGHAQGEICDRLPAPACTCAMQPCICDQVEHMPARLMKQIDGLVVAAPQLTVHALRGLALGPWDLVGQLCEFRHDTRL